MLVISAVTLSFLGASIDSGFENSLERACKCFLDEYRDKRYNKGFRSRHSQNSEDLLLLPTLMASTASGGGGAGLFVELGAFDGMSISNTLLLERCFNWTGVLIEANPENYARLLRSEREAAKVHAAACPLGESVTMSQGAGPMASQLNASAWKSKIRRKSPAVSVACKPLSLIMRETLPAPHRANFLSLDVEGAEAVVLATVDPAAFDIIMVETGMGDRDSASERDVKVHQQITDAGLHLAPAPLAVPNSRVYLKPHIIAHPIRDTRITSQEIASNESTVLVRHERYRHIWRPSPRLKPSHLATVLMKALAAGRPTHR